MRSLAEVLSQGWLGVAIGIVGVVIAIITYLKSRSRAVPAYRTTGIRLIGLTQMAMPKGVTVLYQGTPVPRLTKSYVVFWNAGNQTIRGEDVVARDKIRIETSIGSHILSANVIKATRATNRFSVSISRSVKNAATLGFDYLDKWDGAVIEILHTDERRHPSLKGTIRGIPKGIVALGGIPRISSPVPFPFRLLRRRGFAWTLVLFSMALVAFGATNLLISRNSADNAAWWVMIGLGGLYLFMGAFMIWTLRRRYPTSLHMEELE